MSTTHFRASSYRFCDIKNRMFDLQRVDQGHGLQFSLRWQMSKSTNVIFYMFDFRQGVTCANDCNIQTHENLSQYRLGWPIPIAV